MVAAGLFLLVLMSVEAMEDTEQVKQIRRELQQAEQRAGRLKAILDRMAERAKRLTAELHKLTGGPWDPYGGQIQQMHRKLAEAELIQHDTIRRRVVFSKQPYRYTYIGDSDGDDAYVVDKVTAALVFIRKIGNRRQDRYKKADGSSVSNGEMHGAIDMAATFPEGVDNFKP